MCVNNRLIKNPYTGRPLVVSCGKCPACLQKKANRNTMRVRLATNYYLSQGLVPYFVTLTYDNRHVPYVLKSDLVSNPSFLPVYNSYGKLGFFDNTKTYAKPFEHSKLCNLHNHPLNRLVVGVNYYHDFQNFMKRLRMKIHRLGYNNNIKYFVNSDYGTDKKTFRPHYHFLLFLAKEIPYQVAKNTTYEVWKKCDFYNGYRFFIPRDAASYVASYINTIDIIDPTLTHKAFKPKWRFSKYFGANFVHDLPFVLDAIKKADFEFDLPLSHGVETSIVRVLLPQQILHKYFPKFKSMFKFTTDAIQSIISNFDSPFTEQTLMSRYDYTIDDVYKFRSAVRRSLVRTGLNSFDYAVLYSQYNSSYRRFSFKIFYRDFDTYHLSNNYLYSFDDRLVIDYNNNSCQQKLDIPYLTKFYTHKKHINLNSLVYGKY